MIRQEFEKEFFVDGKFDSEKFNWKRYSGDVARYCPEKIDPDKFNWGVLFVLLKCNPQAMIEEYLPKLSMEQLERYKEHLTRETRKENLIKELKVLMKETKEK